MLLLSNNAAAVPPTTFRYPNAEPGVGFGLKIIRSCSHAIDGHSRQTQPKFAALEIIITRSKSPICIAINVDHTTCKLEVSYEGIAADFRNNEILYLEIILDTCISPFCQKGLPSLSEKRRIVPTANRLSPTLKLLVFVPI